MLVDFAGVYAEAGSVAAGARVLGMSEATFHRRLQKAGVDTRQRGLQWDYERVLGAARLYFEYGSLVKVAKCFGVGAKNLRREFERWHVPIRSAGRLTPMPMWCDPYLDDEEEVAGGVACPVRFLLLAVLGVAVEDMRKGCVEAEGWLRGDGMAVAGFLGVRPSVVEGVLGGS